MRYYWRVISWYFDNNNNRIIEDYTDNMVMPFFYEGNLNRIINSGEIILENMTKSAKFSPQDKAEFMEQIALTKFYSGMPTVAYDNKEYGTTYWRGPTWLNVAYFAAKGLKNYGFKVADDIKETILSWVDKNKDFIYENYNSTTGEGIYGEDFSWSSVFTIEFILSF